jgi:hypothetical protein
VPRLWVGVCEGPRHVGRVPNEVDPHSGAVGHESRAKDLSMRRHLRRDRHSVDQDRALRNLLVMEQIEKVVVGVRQAPLLPFDLHGVRPLRREALRSITDASAGVARLSVRQRSVHFLGGDRQVSNAHADGVFHGVGDGGRDRSNGVLPNPPGVVGARAALRR